MCKGIGSRLEASTGSLKLPTRSHTVGSAGEKAGDDTQADDLDTQADLLP